MRLAFQVSLALLIGLGALYPGVMNFLFPEQVFADFFALNLTRLESGHRLAIETQVRLLAGMWIAAGMFLLLAPRRFERHGMLIRSIGVERHFDADLPRVVAREHRDTAGRGLREYG